MPGQEVLGLVLARAGSKSVPRKNVYVVHGKPLLAYTIEAALAAHSITRLVVTTDDPEIGEMGRRLGAEAPFLRPANLARDETTDYPVIRHALEQLDAMDGYRPDMIVQLRPTSPLRTNRHIDEAVELLRSRPDADSVRAVCRPQQNPHKMWRMTSDGLLQPLLSVPGIEEPFNAPRQTLPVVWWQNGYVDAFWWRTVVDQHSLTGARVLGYVIDEPEYVDVDSLHDLRVLDIILQGRDGPRP
jgi:CMP-N,N'-diacetyllegionaminic acid synthase